MTSTPPAPPEPPTPSVPAEESAPSTGPCTPARVVPYRCPRCGATITYAPGTTELTCPSCGEAQAIDAPAGLVHEHGYDAWLASGPKPVAQVALETFQCQSCGATSDSDQLAGACPFCGGALVAVVEPEGLIMPAGVVPFKLDKAAAAGSFGSWIKSRWFAPNSLKKLAVLRGGLQGVYAPHWTYDAQTATNYTGSRGEQRTRWRTVTDAQGHTHQEAETYIEWYPVSGHVEHFFDDVLIPGTTRVVPEHLAALEPWGLDSAVPYRPEYLVGFSATRYDVDPDRGLEEAKAAMSKVIENDCRDDIGGDEQRVRSMDTAWSELMFKLLLLPIWIAAYTYRGQTYQVVVNAQTGEVLGDRPYSWVKISLAVLAGLIGLAAIVAAVVLHRGGGPT